MNMSTNMNMNMRTNMDMNMSTNMDMNMSTNMDMSMGSNMGMDMDMAMGDMNMGDMKMHFYFGFENIQMFVKAVDSNILNNIVSEINGSAQFSYLIVYPQYDR